MKDADPHVLNFYEDVNLPLTDVPDLIEKAITGKLDDPREKLDGQNFTFTINRLGDVRFMGKGCPKWIRSRGGLDRRDLHEIYDGKPQVQRAFVEALDVMQSAVNSMHHDSVMSLFKGGDVVVSSEVVTPINQNIVKYTQNALCFIEGRMLGAPSSFNSMSSRAFCEFCDAAKKMSPVMGWSLMDVPSVKPRLRHDVDATIKGLVAEFNGLTSSFRLGPNATMGDLLTLMVEKRIALRVPLVGAHLRRAARRLACDDASIMRHSDFPSRSAWESFRALDDERATFVGDCIAPVEDFFRRLGAATIEGYDFVLADVNDTTRINELRAFVGRVREALATGRVTAPTANVLQRINGAARRVDEQLFTRNVEGIVFRWNGQPRKLTGAFTAINRLHGFFNFDDPALIIDAKPVT